MSRIINVVATPNAASNRIVVSGELDTYRVYVTSPPESGKANAAVVKLLSKFLGLPKSSMTVVRGTTSRNKAIEISD